MQRRTVAGLVGSLVALGAASAFYFSRPSLSRQVVYRHEGLQIILDTNTEYKGRSVANLLYVSPDVGPDRRPSWKVIGMDYDGDGKIDRSVVDYGSAPVSAFRDDWLSVVFAKAKEFESKRQAALIASSPTSVPSAR
jgi:hypothetical protein